MLKQQGQKGKWKKTVKERIEKEFINETKIKEKEMNKLRREGVLGKKGYIKGYGEK